jgi:phosphoglycolate phosphatase-like HAD superfamily hydrolase
MILLDVDGTAVGWGDYHQRYFSLMSKAYGMCGGSGLTIEEGDEIFFESDSLLRERKIDPERFWNVLEKVDMTERLRSARSGDLGAYEDTSALYRLTVEGIHYAWITNLPYAVATATLSACGLENPAVIGGNYRGHKPDGGRVRREMAVHQIPDACALVGNTDVDMQTALALDVPGILVNRSGNGYNGPEPYCAIDSLHGLPEVLKKLQLL